MKWDEFRDMLIGLSPETPLGRIVSIRAEDDPEMLKHFTKEQHRIRSEWRNKSAKRVSEAEMGVFLEQMKNALVKMAGGVQN